MINLPLIYFILLPESYRFVTSQRQSDLDTLIATATTIAVNTTITTTVIGVGW